jgi:hypothetical protein
VEKTASASAAAWSWIPIYGATALASLSVKRSKRQIGRETGLIALSFAFSGLGLGLVFLANGLYPLLGFVVLHELGRGLFSPLIDTFIQKHVGEHYRATYGSLQSLIGRAGYGMVLLAVTVGTIGRPATTAVISWVFGAAGAGLALSSVFLWIFRPKYSPP